MERAEVRWQKVFVEWNLKVARSFRRFRRKKSWKAARHIQHWETFFHSGLSMQSQETWRSGPVRGGNDATSESAPKGACTVTRLTRRPSSFWLISHVVDFNLIARPEMVTISRLWSTFLSPFLVNWAFSRCHSSLLGVFFSVSQQLHVLRMIVWIMSIPTSCEGKSLQQRSLIDEWIFRQCRRSMSPALAVCFLLIRELFDKARALPSLSSYSGQIFLPTNCQNVTLKFFINVARLAWDYTKQKCAYKCEWIQREFYVRHPRLLAVGGRLEKIGKRWARVEREFVRFLRKGFPCRRQLWKSPISQETRRIDKWRENSKLSQVALAICLPREPESLGSSNNKTELRATFSPRNHQINLRVDGTFSGAARSVGVFIYSPSDKMFFRPPNDGNGRAIRMRIRWITSRYEARVLSSADQSSIPHRAHSNPLCKFRSPNCLRASVRRLIGMWKRNMQKSINNSEQISRRASGEGIRHRLRVCGWDSPEGDDG